MPFEYSSSKEYLARLLANENINIRRERTRTAYFDLKTRTMVLPFWQTSENVYDLLTVHEISHALHTPKEGWHDAIAVRNLPKSYLNIIEDARIERLINKKYGGTSRVMKEGYKELLEKDIFGLEKNNISVENLPLIDRINLFYKLGTHLYIPFSEEERVWLSKIDQLETWEDVVSLCEELYESEKSKKENLKDVLTFFEDETSDADSENLKEDDSEEETSDVSGSDDTEEDDSDVSGSDDTEEEETSDAESENGEEDDSDAESENGEEDDSDNESENGEEETSDVSGSDDPEEDETEFDPLDSITDNSFRENMEEFEKSITKTEEKQQKMNFSYSIGRQNSDRYVTRIEDFRSLISSSVSAWGEKDVEDIYKNGSNVISMLLKKHIPTINGMIKEFEAKKRADSISRQQYAKTGRLDAKKVHKYQTTEDIFRRNILTQNGKNHGMVMLFDWSGSMSSQLFQTFEQTMVLSVFCHKMNIPFKVCLFQDECNNARQTNIKESTTNDYQVFRGVKLLEVLDSNSSKQTFYQDLFVFFSAVMSYHFFRNGRSKIVDLEKLFGEHARVAIFDRFCEYIIKRKVSCLSGTPLNSALFLMDDYIKKFQTRNKCQITNLVIMTDGRSHDNAPMSSLYNQELFILDKVTGKRYTASGWREPLFETNMLYDVLISRNPSLNVIGFFVSDKSSVRAFYNMSSNYGKQGKKIEGMYVVENNPEMLAHKFFMIVDKNIEIENDWELEENNKGSRTAVKRSFVKHMRNKKSSRVFVSVFVDCISKNM